MRCLFGRGTEKHFLLEDDYEDSSFSGCECHLFLAYVISIIFSHFPLMFQLLTLISHPLLNLEVTSLIDQPDKDHWEV